MNSQSHVLMGAVLFGKPMPKLAMAAALGGLIPDLPMYTIVAGLRMSGHSLDEIFGKLYWEDWWQIANALGHSFLLWGALLAAASWRVSAQMAAGEIPGGGAPLVKALSASALLHSAVDFACHRNDAHMHFWPLSEWRFRSPVSYWDPAHYGQWFGLFEAAIGIACAVILFRRYRSRWLRAALAALVALYIAVPAFFILSMSGHDM